MTQNAYTAHLADITARAMARLEALTADTTDDLSATDDEHYNWDR
jgi:hypothetical protein